MPTLRGIRRMKGLNDDEPLCCHNCDKPITDNTPEPEYSVYLGRVFCSPDCALDSYWEYMESAPVEKDE